MGKCDFDVTERCGEVRANGTVIPVVSFQNKNWLYLSAHLYHIIICYWYRSAMEQFSEQPNLWGQLEVNARKVTNTFEFQKLTQIFLIFRAPKSWGTVGRLLGICF